MKKNKKYEYIFQYPDYGTPDNHPDYTAHSGHRVRIIRELSDDECDPCCQPMYKIRASDGWFGNAHSSELRRIAG